MSLIDYISEEIRRNLLEIPQGTFLMGYTLAEDEQPIHKVSLGSFYIMSYLVTNRQYAIFLNENREVNEIEGSYRLINPFNRNTRIKYNGSIYLVDNGYENHPVIGVNWEGAKSFVEWLGGRLPTEAEWEKSARGGLENKIYWWGNESPKPYLGNYAEIIGYTVPVGQFHPNGFGLFDIEGNASEWCADWYNRDYYANSPTTNPKGPENGTEKVVRGGNWSYNFDSARVAKRDKFWFRIGRTNLGFRAVFDK